MSRGSWSNISRGRWEDDQTQAAIDEALAVYRPSNGSPPASTLYWDADNGDDNNDGLTALTPMATRDAILGLIPTNTPTAVTVQEAAHTVNWALTSTLLNLITFRGTKATQYTATITASAAADDQGVQITVTGITVSANALVGFYVAFGSGAAAARTMLIGANDATSLGSTVIYGNMDPNPNNFDTSVVNPGNVAVTITKPGTVHTLTGGTSIIGSAQLTFRDIDIVGNATNRVLFHNATDQVSYRWCRFLNMRRPQAGVASRVRYEQCFFQGSGFTDGGLSLATNGGQALHQWCVFDGSVGLTNAYVSGTNGGRVGFRGQAFFLNMSDPIRLEGSSIWTDGGVGAEDVLNFENCTGTAISLNKGLVGTAGFGGEVQIANMHSSSGLEWAIEASNGARGTYGASSDAQTSANSGTMAISTDGTSERTTDNRGTLIQPVGSTTAPGLEPSWIHADLADAAGSINLSIYQYQPCDPTLLSNGDIALVLPSAAARPLGSLVGFYNDSTSTVTIALSSASSFEKPSAPGTYGTSDSVGVAAGLWEWVNTGTKWKLRVKP